MMTSLIVVKSTKQVNIQLSHDFLMTFSLEGKANVFITTCYVFLPVVRQVGDELNGQLCLYSLFHYLHKAAHT